MGDTIYRQAAINEIDEWIKAFREKGHKESAADACLIQDGIIQLPSAQPERSLRFRIGEICVDESKGFTSSGGAVEKIRKLLRETERREE